MAIYTFRLDVQTPQHGVSANDLRYVMADRTRVEIVCRAIYIGYSAARAFALACSSNKQEEIDDIIKVSVDLGYDVDIVSHTSNVIEVI